MPSDGKKGITVKIDAGLHAEVRQYLESHGMTMAEFVTLALDDELHPKINQKEGQNMGNMRTLAFQVPEDLFIRIKDYLKRNNMSQKEFVIGLIEDELEREQAFHAKASQLPESGSDLQTIQEELSSLKLPESLKRNGLHIFSWKTSPVCYRMTQAGRLLPSSPRLLSWGMISSGVCITAQISESRSNAGGCTLSQVFEDDVPDGYFLSPTAMRKILNNLSPDRKAQESTIQTEQPVHRQPDQADGAARQGCISST